MSFPLMTVEWVDEITKFINSCNKGAKILECGSGESTTYWAGMKNVNKIVSIEASKEWYKIVKEKIDCLDEDIKSKINYNLVNLDQDILKECNSMHITGWNEYEKFWEPYNNILDNFSDEYFDLVIIDGYDRKRNFLKAMNKVKIGGWIIMHDMLPEQFNLEYEPKDRILDDFKNFEQVFDYYSHGNGRGNYGFALRRK